MAKENQIVTHEITKEDVMALMTIEVPEGGRGMSGLDDGLDGDHIVVIFEEYQVL